MRKSLIVISIGLVARLLVAFLTPQDLPHYDHYSQDAAIWRHGVNIYVEQTNYNYSPVQYHALGIAGAIGDAFGVTQPITWRVLFIIGDVVIAAVMLRKSKRNAAIFWLNPATIFFSAYLGSFETWAILPILYALHDDTSSSLVMGILAVLIKQNVVFFVWALYVYRYGMRRGLLAMLVTACVFALSFAPYLRDGYESIWRNVITYSGVGVYGLATYLPSWLAKAIFFAVMLGLPIFTLRQRFALPDAMQLSALAYCGFIYGASSPMYMFPVYLASTSGVLIVASVMALLLFCPPTRYAGLVLAGDVGWAANIGATAILLVAKATTPLSRRPQIATTRTVIETK